MPSNRTPISRPHRPRFSPQALQLFAELEQMSRRHEGYRDKTHELARLLNLTDEWWAGQHVSDRSQSPCYTPQYYAYGAFYRCRSIRLALLAALGSTQKKPAPGANPARTVQ